MIRGYEPDRLRAGLCAVMLEGVFRILHRSHRDTPLAATPAPSRFSDPQMRYAVLYAATSVRCAFWETLGRNRFARRQPRWLPRSEAEARLVVSIRSEATLSLIDLRGDGPLRIGAPSAASRDGNRSAGRALSAAIHNGRSRKVLRSFRESPYPGQ
ncbi:MAG: RES family NAD+ phosphorylase [Gammaproteobacteria bacterium]|nr:RES family NAD+ phosphorylase [Gammaproteobacteria bacterium]